MQKNSFKIILYIISALLIIASYFVGINAKEEDYSPLWTILPAGLGLTILVLTIFKKLN